MANRYDIVRIDFQANARGANAAIESLRQEAEKSNAALTKTREEIDRALKANAPDDVIAGLRAMAKTEERRYKQLSQAQNELIKGMRVLDQGVKMFNDGSLNQMNAAFQKAVNNAATLAQSKFGTGTKEWREMGAIMQETQQNYARMQRDTDQLIHVIQQGGTVFRSTLEQEKKGIQELMGIVPYMGSEYQKLEGQLQVVTTKLEQMATAERQMKGEIVTSNDARRVAYQLTEEGAAAAKREAEAAEQTIAAGKERISVLEKERKTREDAARATAETVAKRNEDLAMQQNVIASIEKEIANEDRKSKKKREAADVAKQVAESSAQAVETEKAALEGLQATTKTAEEKVKQLQEELTKLGTQKVQPKVDASGIDELKAKIDALVTERDNIEERRSFLQARMDTLTEKSSRRGQSILWKDLDNGIFGQDQLKVYIDQLNAAYKKIGPQKETESYKDYYERLGKTAFPDLKDNVTQFRDWEHLIRSICSQVTELSGQLRAMPNMTGAGANKLFGGFELKEGYLTARQEANRLLKEDNELQQRKIDLGTQQIGIELEIEKLKKNSTTATKDQTETVKQQTAEQKTLKSDIDALTGTIKELKKQRDELTAAQKEGAKSTEGEAQSAQDLMAKMKSLNDEIEKQKKKLVKPEQNYQKDLRFAATAKKPED